MKKKIISMLLCLMLVLSVLPMHADADTSTVKGILAANGITYDDTQYSLACVYAESAVADMLKDQSYYRPEMEDFVNSISIPVSVWIDGKMLAEKIDNKWVSQKYYLISSDGTSCEEKEFSRDINSSRTMAYSEGNGNIIAFLIPKSSEYFLIPYYGTEPYTYMNDPSIPDEYSVFNGSSTHQGTCMGYRGVADSGDMEFEFEMEWNAGCSCIKIEPFVYNPASNIVDMTSFTEEGELNVTYYVELRDPATGEIFPLPKQWYHNIGYSSYDPDATLQANILMREDGLMDMTSDEWTFIDGHYYGCTGEIDLYIPYGYEFRISVYDSNIYQDGQALYGDSLQYSWRGEYAGDGFYRVTKPHFGSNQGWVQVLFAPLTEEIRVEKQVVGSDNGAEYIMHAERTVYELGEDFSTYVPAKQNYQLPLRNYLYRLFDADTDTEIEPAAEHRTDSEGNFSLKGGQYALFRTYTLPENLPSVPTDGANMMFIDNYDQWTDIEKIRDVYSFEEVSTGNFVTSVDLVRNGETTTIDGSKIDKAYGEDEIYFKNVLGDPIVGNLTITKNFLGLEEDEIPVDDIYFTFTADGEKTDEVLYLKDFDCEDGVYSITVPFIVGTYAIEEHGAEIDGYKFTCRIPDSFELNSEGYTLLLDNIYEKKTGSLTVTKTVAGTAADSTEAFSFTVILGDTSVNGVFGDMNFVYGAANFTLKDGESKTASGLPAGTDFTVTEADYSADGYVTTASGDTGTIADGETASAVFTNTKDADEPAPTPPPTPNPEPTPTPTPDPEPAPGPEDPVVPQTGDSIHPVFWAMLLAAGAAGIAGLIVYGKKIKRN